MLQVLTTGLEFITVILGSALEHDGFSQRYSDTIKMFDFGFNNYYYLNVMSKDDIVTEVVINNATEETKTLTLLCDKDISVFTEIKNTNDTILPTITINNNLHAPIQKGDIIGSLKYTALGVEYDANLIAANTVKLSTVLIRSIAVLLLLSIVVLIIILISSKDK